MEFKRYIKKDNDESYKIYYQSHVNSFPKNVVIKNLTKEDSDLYVRPPLFGLYEYQSNNYISPLYVVDTECNDVRWGYTDDNALVLDFTASCLDMYIFPESKNVAHSITYDLLNGKFDLVINEYKKLCNNSKKV